MIVVEWHGRRYAATENAAYGILTIPANAQPVDDGDGEEATEETRE